MNCWCKATMVLGAIVLVALVRPASTQAHPMGNFSINHYAALEVGARSIELHYIIDMAEIPTFQELRDAGIRPIPGMPELELYLRRKAPQLIAGLTLEAGGKPLILRELNHDVVFPPGAGGLPTMKIGLHLRAALPARIPGPSRLAYRDDNFPTRTGWKEIVVRAGPGAALINSSALATDRSRGLSYYPTDMLNSPPQALAAQVSFVLATTPADRSGSRLAFSLTPNVFSTPRSAFTELVTNSHTGIWFFLMAAFIAAALGALHALEPGHGKTVVAAYLVGSRGTFRHALLLGTTVTATHTAGVYLLGVLTLYASNWIVPERLYPWLGVFSGAVIAGLGVCLFVGRVSTPQSDHDHPAHEGTHGHHDSHHLHTHAHHAHDFFGRHIHTDHYEHVQPAGAFHDHASADNHLAASSGPVSLASLLALGVTGGIVPCPAALVVLLGALSIHRVGFGLFLIAAFSLGLAMVLIGLGLAMVYAARLMSQLQFESRLTTRWLPICSSALITLIGMVLVLKELQNAGMLGS